ncbi:MAG: hypothetical protein J6A01_12145 [Proteobacteria bacterium]|nr:hypothetical protein [Pseudomonadota bacterium]
MTKKTRFLTLVCALAGCFAIYGCSENKKDKGQEQPEFECEMDAQCAANAEGKTECDTVNHVCIKPVVAETCGNGALDDGEQCDGTEIASDLSLNCGEGKKLKDSLTCDTKTCKIDLASSCRELECTLDIDCVKKAGKTVCDTENNVCIEPVVAETCGDGVLDEGEQCDGTEIAEDLSLNCGDIRKLKESLTCDTQTCRVDLYNSCELDPEKVDCVKDADCADNAEGKLKCDLDKGICVESQDGPIEYNDCEYPDEDGDGISDEIEGKDENRDTDEDGIPDYQDLDSDGDNIPDSLEGGTNGCSGAEPITNGMGAVSADYINPDVDGNGINDGIECCGADENNGGTCKEGVEKDENGFYTFCIDTNNNDMPDYIDSDNDGDGLADEIEIKGAVNANANLEGDYFSGDCDGDGNPDALGSADAPIDCDGDGVYDYMDYDSDGDGILDSIELENANEAGLMARYLKDTDGDSLADGDEVAKDGHGAKFICDATGQRINQDDHDLVEKAEAGEEGKQVGYYDENGDFVSVELPDGSEYYYEPVSTCTDVECKFRTSCYMTVDCDRDGLGDEKEVWCEGGVWSALEENTDGDEYQDASEYAAYEYAQKDEDHRFIYIRDENGKKVKDENGDYVVYEIDSPEKLICVKDYGVKDVIDFYFELPYVSDETIQKAIEDSKADTEHPENVIENEAQFYEKNPDKQAKDDSLIFEPAVSKLDLVINVDTTSSMGVAIANVKSNVVGLIEKIQGVKNDQGVFENAMVSDAGFALTTFDDFPISSYGSGGDLPFRLLGQVTTDKNMVEAYTKKDDFKVRNGGDLPEAGAESLYQIATGEGVSWSTGKVDPRINAVKGTWGGVGFRDGTLPVVVHITDAPSHDISTSYNNFTENIAYTPADVAAPHYSDVLIPKLKELGIRVITLYVGHQDANKYNQMYTWAKESEAVVPVCAFSTETAAATQCLLGVKSDPESLNGKEKQCVLFYQGEQSETAQFVSQGVDAIVKYGTYDVSTVVRGEPINGIVDDNGNPVEVDTSCFIQKVSAVQYIAPPNEPEHSCNPVAEKNKIGDSEFENGFTNFAPGTSNVYDPEKPDSPGNKKGAQLEFQVVAQNYDCVPETEEVQVFKAYIDVVNPTTGLVFGTREVSIIVPAKPIVINDPTN